MDFRDFISFIITSFLKPVEILIVSATIVYFLWSIAQVVMNSDKGDMRDQLKERAVWGIVAIFVMVSVWGLVNVLVRTFMPGGVTTSQSLPLFQ